MRNARFLWAGVATMLLTGAWPAAGSGVSCQQSCSGGSCQQAICVPASSGSCSCLAGAVRLTANDFAAFCGAWGQTGPTCQPAPALVSGVTPGTASPASAALANAGSMMTVLASQNPYAAALLRALNQQGAWAVGTVQGIIHGAHHDSVTGATTHDTAVPFSASISLAAGTATVNILVQGDLTQLTRLQQYCASSVPSAAVPASISGTVVQGGLHGALQITPTAGPSQSIQW